MPTTKAKSNVALLTEGAAYIQRAKKARKEQVEEIKFDDEARREWLTGFSKRKKAKAEEKKARAKERERQEHLEERRNARKELKQRAAENVQSVRRAMGLEDDEDDDEEEEGDSNEDGGQSASKNQEAEFSDDEQIATITITEDFDPSALVYPIRTSTSPSPSANDKSEPQSRKPAVKLLPPSSKRAQKADEKKKEKKKISRSMETKAERRKGKEMELRKRSKKAALALERKGKTPRGPNKGKGKGRR
ncbi:ribosomal RNA-processing protein 17 [Cryptococcus deuterogattii MMRL2647]|nr:ribosomal RNA-processing protein 17 [Cryptococcus deuterogattii MMRL2647]